MELQSFDSISIWYAPGFSVGAWGETQPLALVEFHCPHTSLLCSLSALHSASWAWGHAYKWKAKRAQTERAKWRATQWAAMLVQNMLDIPDLALERVQRHKSRIARDEKDAGVIGFGSESSEEPFGQATVQITCV